MEKIQGIVGVPTIIYGSPAFKDYNPNMEVKERYYVTDIEAVVSGNDFILIDNLRGVIMSVPAGVIRKLLIKEDVRNE